MILLALLLAVALLLASALCSCRSDKQAVSEYADTASIACSVTSASSINGDLFAIVERCQATEISGIVVEFYPPDSTHPDVRAAPKSIAIENVKSGETLSSVARETVSCETSGSANAVAESSSSSLASSRSETAVRGIDYFPILLALAAFAFAAVLLLRAFGRR